MRMSTLMEMHALTESWEQPFVLATTKDGRKFAGHLRWFNEASVKYEESPLLPDRPTLEVKPTDVVIDVDFIGAVQIFHRNKVDTPAVSQTEPSAA